MKNYFRSNAFEKRMENTAVESSVDGCIFLVY